jgi:DNA-binding response OmpR family regulator
MTHSVGKVLIIDDEPVLRNTLGRVLQAAGCQAMTASGGAEAFALLAEQEFDLVYLDLHLPDMDGIQILTEIRQRQPRLPVIMLTGYGTMQSAVDALRLGAADYLLKPFDPDVLTARTRMMLSEQRVERRKDELRQQIMALQSELAALEHVDRRPVSETVATPANPQDRFLKMGRLILDLQARRATFGERVLNLPPAAFDYLLILARRSPQVVSYATLVADAQNYRVEMAEARELAKYHVYVLRQALEDDPQNPRYLLNVRGTGYRLLID